MGILAATIEVPETPMLKQTRVRLGAYITVAIIAILVFRQTIETRFDREAVADRLRNCAARVRKNPKDSESLGQIISALNGRWSFGRTYACTVLGDLGPLAETATPELVTALDSGDPFVEREAVRALGRVGVGRREPVDPLIRRLRVGNRDVAYFAAESLGLIGQPALVALPELRNAAKTSDQHLARNATIAIEKLELLREGDTKAGSQNID